MLGILNQLLRTISSLAKRNIRSCTAPWWWRRHFLPLPPSCSRSLGNIHGTKVVEERFQKYRGSVVFLKVKRAGEVSIRPRILRLMDHKQARHQQLELYDRNLTTNYDTAHPIRRMQTIENPYLNETSDGSRHHQCELKIERKWIVFLAMSYFRYFIFYTTKFFTWFSNGQKTKRSSKLVMPIEICDFCQN